ncbi:two-component system response regulator [Paramagnetospirillum kuznetsovii]|uniref:Two-component system response regulator n=1 Tax=Paramagnetospirillum kuznetsovii TaxID=2053833 RepID=A0A364NTI5_9PROT|nr:HD domain-containing phosphohydrolase [Paramagnetospirillum kuznetsovii]RAU20378.1 two-component system response regulator [Paramagnetospirillum kuznetsovii]
MQIESRTIFRQELVMVVDASESHRRQVEHALMSFYRIATFASTSEALAALQKSPPGAIVIAKGAVTSEALDFVAMVRRDHALSAIPVVLIGPGDDPGIRKAAMECGASSFLAKPYRRSVLIGAISKEINKAIEHRWEKLPTLHRNALVGTMDIFNSVSDVIENGEPIAYSAVTDACGPLIEAVGTGEFRTILSEVRGHDNFSYAHSLGVATLLLLFGYTIGLKGDDLSLLGSGGLLHDVGKMSIPYDVLNKVGALSPAELEQMKGHVAVTTSYLEKCSDLPKNIHLIGNQHHERLNGTGYPIGLKGSELNELARMSAIVDVFCALSDRRPYKSALDSENALQVMTNSMTAALDQQLLALFREMLLDTGR